MLSIKPHFLTDRGEADLTFSFASTNPVPSEHGLTKS